MQGAQNNREVGSWTIDEIPTLLALIYSDDAVGRDEALHATGLLALDHANHKQLTEAGDGMCLVIDEANERDRFRPRGGVCIAIKEVRTPGS